MSEGDSKHTSRVSSLLSPSAFPHAFIAYDILGTSCFAFAASSTGGQPRLDQL